MNIIQSIRNQQTITSEQLDTLLSTSDEVLLEDLRANAQEVARSVYGNGVYIRGLIEISSYCRNDCYYCGLRCSNRHAVRYRLSEEEILSSCENGYRLGFRTFVMQGGEDVWFTDERICSIVSQIRKRYPSCAITLSLGERSRESYQALFEAGADRYLLRHETADADHYARLHPSSLSWHNRMRCLRDLKEIGYQVGCGFMVGAPYQTIATLHADLCFIEQFRPAMVGIGPFVPTRHTPFADEVAGDVDRTLRLLSIIRLIHPHVLLPATTALGSLDPRGREKGVLAGANVVMPNVSPLAHRKDYNIYDNKLTTGGESAERLDQLRHDFAAIGYEVLEDRGDFKE